MSDKDWDKFNNEVDLELRKQNLLPMWMIATTIIIAVAGGSIGIILVVKSLCT